MEIRKTTTYQNLWKSPKAIFRGKLKLLIMSLVNEKMKLIV